jgi:hypothetical protein
MIVEIEYPISIEALPARGKNTKTVVFKDSVRVDIPVYDGHERVLAMRTTGRELQEGRSYWGMGGALYTALSSGLPAAEFIPYDLTLTGAQNHIVSDVHSELMEKLKRLRSSFQAQLSSALHPKSLADALIEGMNWTGTPNHTGRLPIPLSRLTDIPLREFNEADIENQKNSFRRHMENFAISDGALYRKATEPMYYVDHRNRDGYAVKVSVMQFGFISGDQVASESDPTAPYLTPLCSALDRDAAIALATEYSNSTGVQLRVDEEMIEVYREEFVTDLADRLCQINVAKSIDYEMFHRILGLHASEIGDHVWYNKLKNCDITKVLAWRRLTDAIKHGDIDLINETVHETLKLPIFGNKSLSNAAKFWSMAADQWSDKTISIERSMSKALR